MSGHIPQQPGDPTEILLVEDNPGDIRLIEEAFKASNHQTQIHTVINGEDALSWLTHRSNEGNHSLPDIVLLDLNLPGGHGCDVLNAIRAESKIKLLPVIVLTSSSDSDDIQRCYQADANAFLTKPVGPQDFESLAEKIGQFWFNKATLAPVSA